MSTEEENNTNTNETVDIVFKATSGANVCCPDKIHTVPLSYTLGDLKDYVINQGVISVSSNDSGVDSEPLTRGTLRFVHSGRILSDNAVQLKDLVSKQKRRSTEAFYIFYRPQTATTTTTTQQQQQQQHPPPPPPPLPQQNQQGEAHENNVRVIRININLGFILQIGIVLYAITGGFKKNLGALGVVALGYMLYKIGFLGWVWRTLFASALDNNNNNNNINTNTAGAEGQQNGEEARATPKHGALERFLRVQFFPFFLSLSPSWKVNEYAQKLKEEGFIQDDENENNENTNNAEGEDNQNAHENNLNQ